MNLASKQKDRCLFKGVGGFALLKLESFLPIFYIVQDEKEKISINVLVNPNGYSSFGEGWETYNDKNTVPNRTIRKTTLPVT